MKELKTEVCILLDASGSMRSIKRETVMALNDFLAAQAELEGRVRISLRTFHSEVHPIWDRLPLEEVLRFDASMYNPKGVTALYDALGGQIRYLEDVIAQQRESERPDIVMMLVITDGVENGSQEFDGVMVHSLLQRKNKDAGWEFFLLGAGSSLHLIGNRLDIPMDQRTEFKATAQGIREGLKKSRITMHESHRRNRRRPTWNPLMGPKPDEEE